MTDFMQIVSSLREQMNATLSRSDVLRPLAWLVALLGTICISALWMKAPVGILTIFVLFLGLAVVLYIFAYGFCLFADRDALRSERYSLHKMALEHGFYGDNRMGLVDPAADTKSQIVDASAAASKTGFTP